MRIKLLVARATAKGPENRGEEIEVSAAEGARMIAAGQAEPVRVAPAERSAGRGQKPERA